MKIAVLYDSISESMKASTFIDMIGMYKDVEAEIKILCRGMEGRVGDKYDYLRGRDDVFWSEGLPPLSAIGSEKGWFPDVVMNMPENFPLREFM